MAQLPISADDASKEIKALIEEKGLDTITSKIIRKHLEVNYNIISILRDEHIFRLDSTVLWKNLRRRLTNASSLAYPK